MIRGIYFDMDGTIADLYSVNNWLGMLQAESTMPYEVASPMGDVELINALLSDISDMGVHVGIISWSAMNASSEYNQAVAIAKRNWAFKNFPVIKDICVVPYGFSKQDARDTDMSILFDDNREVRELWECGMGRRAYAPDEIVKVLLEVLASF